MDGLTLRPLTAADLGAIDALRPADWPPYRPTFEHFFRTPCCEPWGLEGPGGLAAMATLITFGPSAWVAQLITGPEARGQGLGTRLLGHLTALAGRRGAATVSLVATDLGYPLYLKAGFRVEDSLEFWERGEPTAALGPGQDSPGVTLRPLEPGDLDAVWALDRRAAGEDRRPYAQALGGGAWAAAGPGGLEGFWFPAWGEGFAAAGTPAAGQALLGLKAQASARVVVPASNPAAGAFLASRGFRLVRRAPRMVLGPALDRNPALAWGRVGGNLG